MEKKKMTFALAFCNRGFMPGELIYGAREDMIRAVTDAGYDYIAMDAELTRYGGIETRDEGLLYAKWLKEHEGQYDGVIFSMPIFADENGALPEGVSRDGVHLVKDACKQWLDYLKTHTVEFDALYPDGPPAAEEPGEGGETGEPARPDTSTEDGSVQG